MENDTNAMISLEKQIFCDSDDNDERKEARGNKIYINETKVLISIFPTGAGESNATLPGKAIYV